MIEGVIVYGKIKYNNNCEEYRRIIVTPSVTVAMRLYVERCRFRLGS